MNSSSYSLAGELLLEPNVTAVTCDWGQEKAVEGRGHKHPWGQFLGAPLLPVALNQTLQLHTGKAPRQTPASPTPGVCWLFVCPWQKAASAVTPPLTPRGNGSSQ